MAFAFFDELDTTAAFANAFDGSQTETDCLADHREFDIREFYVREVEFQFSSGGNRRLARRCGWNSSIPQESNAAMNSVG